jgi:CO/xanthine dehydrogenase FAD-binding subunit
VAQRLTRLENNLSGRRINDQLEHLPIRDHLAPLSPIDDVRASADYRLEATLRLIGRCLRRFTESI